MQIQQENATAIDNNIPELGHQQTVSHVDLGQFPTHGDTGTGRFTCGLAALNCVRTVFEKEGRGIKGEQLLREVLARETAQEINSICSYWNSPFNHLDVEDIIQVPWFSKMLALSMSAVRGPPMRCDFHSFMKLLLQMDVVSETTESAALMITCPPEVVACLKIHTSRGDVFLIFESQFRPNKSSGASFFINTSMDATAVYLAALFNAEKHSSERDTSRQFQWHADTTSHFIGHILVPVQSDVNDRKSAKQTLLESSMTILKLNAELAAMKSEISSLATELETSKNTMSNLVENMRTRAHEIIKAQESLPSTNQRREKIASPETPHLPPPISTVQFQHSFHYRIGASEQARRESREYHISSMFEQRASKLVPTSVNGGGRVHLNRASEYSCGRVTEGDDGPYQLLEGLIWSKETAVTPQKRNS